MSHEVQLSPLHLNYPAAFVDPGTSASRRPAAADGRTPRPDMRRVLSHPEIRPARPSPALHTGLMNSVRPAGGSSAGRRQTIHLLLVRPWKQRKQTLKS